MSSKGAVLSSRGAVYPVKVLSCSTGVQGVQLCDPHPPFSEGSACRNPNDGIGPAHTQIQVGSPVTWEDFWGPQGVHQAWQQKGKAYLTYGHPHNQGNCASLPGTPILPCTRK